MAFSSVQYVVYSIYFPGLWLYQNLLTTVLRMNNEVKSQKWPTLVFIFCTDNLLTFLNPFYLRKIYPTRQNYSLELIFAKFEKIFKKY